MTNMLATQGVQAVSSGAGTVTPDLRLANYFALTCTAGTITIAAPSVFNEAFQGQILYVDVLNSSGGALTITWNAIFRQTTVPTAPANTKERVYTWFFNGTNWILVNGGTDS